MREKRLILYCKKGILGGILLGKVSLIIEKSFFYKKIKMECGAGISQILGEFRNAPMGFSRGEQFFN